MSPPSPHSPTWRINSSMQWNGSTESISNFPHRNPSRPSCRIQPEICYGWHQCLAAGCHYADPLCMRLGICVFTSSCLDPLSERKLSSDSCRRNLLLFPVLLNERGWPIWYNCCWTSSRKPYWELIFCIGEDIIFGPPVLAAHWVVQADSECGTLIAVQHAWTGRTWEEWLKGGEEESQTPRTVFSL